MGTSRKTRSRVKTKIFERGLSPDRIRNWNY